MINKYKLIHFSGTFRWAGSHQVAGYTNWARSDGSSEDTPEPNGGTAENCVYKSLSYPPGWSDYRCDATEADGMPCFALCRHGDLPQPPTPTPPTTTPPPANTGRRLYIVTMSSPVNNLERNVQCQKLKYLFESESNTKKYFQNKIGSVTMIKWSVLNTNLHLRYICLHV